MWKPANGASFGAPNLAKSANRFGPTVAVDKMPPDTSSGVSDPQRTDVEVDENGR